MAAPYRVLRVTLNRLPGTFRRHVYTGRHQTRPERAGSASELKPSETNATIAGVLCRRSPYWFPLCRQPAFLSFLLEENGNGRFTVLHSHRTFPSTWNNKNPGAWNNALRNNWFNQLRNTGNALFYR